LSPDAVALITLADNGVRLCVNGFFKQIISVESAEEAVTSVRKAISLLQLTETTNTDRSVYDPLLAECLMGRYKYSKAVSDLEEASQLLRRVLNAHLSADVTFDFLKWRVAALMIWAVTGSSDHVRLFDKMADKREVPIEEDAFASLFTSLQDFAKRVITDFRGAIQSIELYHCKVRVAK